MLGPARLGQISPIYIPIFMMGDVITQVAGTWAEAVDALALSVNNAYFTNDTAAANGDSFSFYFYCPAGKYKITIAVYLGLNCGRIDTYMDDVKIDSLQSLYSAAGGTGPFELTTQPSLESGRHKVTITVNGKSALSLGYRAPIISMQLIRMA
jgi:hypothetical protein